MSGLSDAQTQLVNRELRIDELEGKIVLRKRELKALMKEYEMLIGQRKPTLNFDL